MSRPCPACVMQLAAETSYGITPPDDGEELCFALSYLEGAALAAVNPDAFRALCLEHARMLKEFVDDLEANMPRAAEALQ